MSHPLARVGGVVGLAGLVGIVAFGTRYGRDSPVAALLGLGDGTGAFVVSVGLLATGVVLVDRFWERESADGGD
ncbi:hypothetical protein [Haloarcula marina]|uniref:hypothetical protein n=1 Tax=Haloarcula marina TaxID=2961574 RepID=UPI0020B73100|nr:hypothetical protein [Halomicroarcula marina]